MEWYQILLIAFAVIIVLLYIYKRCTGTDLLKMIIMSRPVQVALTSVIEALYVVIPSKTLSIIKHVLDASVKATQLAEQAWLMGQLPRDERNEYAKSWATTALEALGIEVTPQIEAIIAGVIEMTCMVLPHGVEPYGVDTNE